MLCSSSPHGSFCRYYNSTAYRTLDISVDTTDPEPDYVWTEPTLEEEGLGHYVCSVCGNTQYLEINKAHVFGDWSR